MHAVQTLSLVPEAVAPSWSEARVAAELGAGRYRLDDGRAAAQAASCLVQPMVGDRVLAAGCGGECYVVHLLARSDGAQACLAVPGAHTLAIRQAQIDLSATERVAIRSLRDVEVTATAGTLSLNARNLFTTVTESLVENARHYVGQMGQYLLGVKSLLRLHGEQALVTAEKDIKVDAERISMG